MSEVSDRKQRGGASAADAVGIEEAGEAEAESQAEDLEAEGDSAGTEEGQASEELDEEVGEEGVWRVYRAKDFTTTLLDYEPGAEGSHPTGIDLRRAAIRTGGEPEGVYSLDKLDRILQNVRRTGRSLKAYPICEARDADHSVDISEDRLKATLHIRKGRGLGKALVLKEVGAAIRESGVKGLDNERIKTDVLEFFRSADRGQTWEFLSYLQPYPPHSTSEPSILTLPDGRLLLYARENRDDGFPGIKAYSRDNCRTWEVEELPFAIAGRTCAGLLPDGRAMLTFRSEIGRCALWAWIGDPHDTTPFCAAGSSALQAQITNNEATGHARLREFRMPNHYRVLARASIV